MQVYTTYHYDNQIATNELGHLYKYTGVICNLADSYLCHYHHTFCC